MRDKLNMKRLASKMRGAGSGDKPNLRMKPDGTIDKRRTYNKASTQSERDMDGGMPRVNIFAKSINRQAQEKADENRAKHRNKVKDMLRKNNAAGAETVVSTRSNSTRNLVKEAEDEKARQAEERAALRKKQRYY